MNIIDDKDIALGYPLKQLKVLGDKIECVPIPEILSYEGYISQISKQDDKLDDYFNVSFKAANNEYYNYWLPIYINEEHFQRNRTLILNSFSVLKYGAKGKKEYDFEPEHIFEYMPNLLNKMICGMFTNKSYMSEAYIRCYFQYLLLFKKLINEFKEDFEKYLNNIIDQIKKNNYVVNRFIVPDLGNLFMLLFFSDINIDNKIWNILFKEKIVRKMYWTFHDDENTMNSKKILNDFVKDKIDRETNQKILDILKKENLFYYEYLDNIKIEKEYQPCKEECLLSLSKKEIPKTREIQPLKGIFSDCIKTEIFEKIVEIISNGIISKPKSLKDIICQEKKLKANKKLKNKIRQKILYEFPQIYKNECSSDNQIKIDKLLLKNVNLIKYCSTEFKEKNNIKEIDFFKNYEVEKLLKSIDEKYHLEIVKKLYDASRGKLLIISTLAQKKMNESGFLKELEKNFGIFLNVKDFIKDFFKKREEIKCYKDLFNFMKEDVIDKDEDEYEMIIQSYENAKKKRYIKVPYKDKIEDLKFIRGKNFEKNDNLKNRNNGNNRKRRTNYQMNNNNRINRNDNTNRNNNNPERRRRNNFNSHIVDLDEFLGE